MILGIVIGLVFGVLLTYAALSTIGKRLVERRIMDRKIAIAAWDDKSKQWKVRGAYLYISGKIHEGIRRDDGSVKYEM